MTAEFDQLLKEYEKFKAKRKQVDNPLERVGLMQSELAELTASATSPSGKVTIVAGPGGSIRDIQLTEDAVRQPAAALAAELRATVQQAVAAAAREQAQVVDRHMGGQLDVYDRVMENQAEAFGTTIDELKESLGEAPKPAARPPRSDDDFSENTLMSKDHGRSRPAPPPPSGGSAGSEFLKNLFDEDEK